MKVITLNYNEMRYPGIPSLIHSNFCSDVIMTQCFLHVCVISIQLLKQGLHEDMLERQTHCFYVMTLQKLGYKHAILPWDKTKSYNLILLSTVDSNARLNILLPVKSE